MTAHTPIQLLNFDSKPIKIFPFKKARPKKRVTLRSAMVLKKR